MSLSYVIYVQVFFDYRKLFLQLIFVGIQIHFNISLNKTKEKNIKAIICENCFLVRDSS